MIAPTTFYWKYFRSFKFELPRRLWRLLKEGTPMKVTIEFMESDEIPMIPCRCGSQQMLPALNSQGRPVEYIDRHRNKRANHWRWKNGRCFNDRGYVLILAPHHPRKNSGDYVYEHILVYEDFHKCCILPWICVHHINGDRQDNRPENLELMTRKEHGKEHHPHSSKQQCPNCNSYDTKKNGLHSNKRQRCTCSSCKHNWIIGGIYKVRMKRIVDFQPKITIWPPKEL